MDGNDNSGPEAPRQRAATPGGRRDGLALPGRAVLMGASVFATAAIAAGLRVQDAQSDPGQDGITVEQPQEPPSPSLSQTPPAIGEAPEVSPSQEQPDAQSAAS